MSHLGEFQDRFARALLDGADDSSLARQPGFAVYRNTVMKGCIDALVANFPAVTRLVGDEWMRAASAIFVRANLPAAPMLLDYGEGFAAFLAAFEPAAEMTYLPGVAQLDRLWTEAHGAPDEPVLVADRVAALAQDTLAGAVLRPHASARWAWFDEQPIFTIWARNRNEGPADESEIPWHGEGALLVRPVDTVNWHALTRGDVVFLDACAARRPIADAALAAVEAEPGIDLSLTMARLLSAGAFGEIA